MKICVVGAGASGLTAIKTSLENSFDVVCFEKSGDIGGLWRYKKDPCPGEGTVMKSTVINTSKELTAYSDYPPPADAPNFMHNTELMNYFRSYAQHFDLQKYIRFHTEVTSIKRNENFEANGQWKVTYVGLKDNEEREEKTEIFSGLMLCSGHHVDPYWPVPFPGQTDFKGTILHSHDYKDPLRFDDKRVIVVGIGNSGGDIAVELSKIAKKVYLATRTGSWVMNRIWRDGEPADLVFINRFAFAMKSWTPLCIVNRMIEYNISKRFDHGRYGLKPKHRFLQAHVTINDELPNRIASGTVVIKPNIGRFHEYSVVFEDGTKVDDVDVVIFATGYSFGFPMLENGKLIPVEENKVNLYQYMYPPELAHKNTLAVIGLIQPVGSIMPISEMQCRVFCEVLAGRATLPDGVRMQKNIDKKRNVMAKEFIPRRRHTIQVYYVNYMDELAKLINVKPKIIKYLFTDPNLARVLIFHGLAPYQYRLNGSNSWPEARKTLLEMDSRIFETTRTRRTKETLKSKPFNKFTHFFTNLLF
ncbi:Dimethylaniline monooxygenase [N-oxide-forming] 5 [Toxocara canis]|uniref:Flavin-containing monooxygenase n=1 Tax=Toxocara canis TaxID=6265 RepID=A0A0B2VMY2_TOXCA|nr:Dimethylaniline monooxygenase [N-oxide-forming] 5 [Toxocara canis]